MAVTTKTKKSSKKSAPRTAAGASAKSKPSKAAVPAQATKIAKPRITLAQVMTALQKAGSEQTRKTYLRQGAKEPLFGVRFGTLKPLLKAIGVDHELAIALWETGNLDARNLAVKIVDPQQMTAKDLDHWAKWDVPRTCGGYVAVVASEGPHAMARAKAWLASQDVVVRATGWTLVGMLAMRNESVPDSWFSERVPEIEKQIHNAPNALREPLNMALIQIGCRNAALRKLATAAAKRIGKVDVDHGATACKTPDAVAYIDKTWTHSTSKGFASPAAHERSRESPRLRC
jgi:3-methyladenine DNA glycosylase AlkD